MPYRTIRLALYLLVSLASLAALYVAVVWYRARADCVVLSNGYMIGHVSVSKLWVDEDVDMLLRDPSGKAIIRTDGFVNIRRDPSDPDRVVLRVHDTDLSLDAEYFVPAILVDLSSWPYSRYLEENTGGAAADDHILGTGLYYIYKQLRKSPRFQTVTCGTPWFDWGE